MLWRIPFDFQQMSLHLLCKKKEYPFNSTADRMHFQHLILTLNMQGRSYPSLTKTVSWQLQHYFMFWLGTVRQQVITWTHIDQVSWCISDLRELVSLSGKMHLPLCTYYKVQNFLISHIHLHIKHSRLNVDCLVSESKPPWLIRERPLYMGEDCCLSPPHCCHQAGCEGGDEPDLNQAG